MKKTLRVEWFLTTEAMVGIINDFPIAREDIQTIIHSDGRFYLYYWR